MSDTIIRVEGLGKKYIIGRQLNGSDGLRHALNDLVTAPARWLRAKSKEQRARGEEQRAKSSSPPLALGPLPLAPRVEDFWALRDVSFEVARGEVIGIIGRNGAGKSTLLKILSRITEPTEGRVRIRGRVASLLEVGTGFHPELTGRENVFLNGAILGMSREEIRRKFDEIVAFAEIEKFLDTPVKRYSSGMYVRLAFAVAAHLEPEILLVDEVLAVGDARFQKKCLGKMGEVAREGRTVLFVSHNLVAVESLCSHAVLLQSGQVMNIGGATDVIQAYVSKTGNPTSVIQFSELTPRSGTGEGKFIGLRLQDQQGRQISRLLTCQPLVVEISFEAGVTLSSTRIGILVKDRYDKYICDMRAEYRGKSFSVEAGKRYVFKGVIDSLPLYPGKYTLGVWIARVNSQGEDIDFIPDACQLVVEANKGLLVQGELTPKWGQFFLASDWQQVELSD